MKEYTDWCRAICKFDELGAEFRCPICGALLMLPRQAAYMQYAQFNTRYHRLAVHLAESKHSVESVEEAAMAAILGSQGETW
jgi:predicted RNA-binding Zn-ribbon protein involved in translation (DUF1610 family)